MIGMGDTFSEVEKGNSSRGMNGVDGGLSPEKLFGGQHFGFLRRASNGSASYARGSVSFVKDSVEDAMSKFDRMFHRMNEWARRNWVCILYCAGCLVKHSMIRMSVLFLL